MKKKKSIYSRQELSDISSGIIACILSLRYGFYTIIRFPTAIIAGCWDYKFFCIGKRAYAIIACSILLLFQPFFKITLDRFTWNAVDILVAFLITFLVLKKQ